MWRPDTGTILQQWANVSHKRTYWSRGISRQKYIWIRHARAWAFAAMWLMCSTKDELLSINTPRSLTQLALATIGTKCKNTIQTVTANRQRRTLLCAIPSCHVSANLNNLFNASCIDWRSVGDSTIEYSANAFIASHVWWSSAVLIS